MRRKLAEAVDLAKLHGHEAVADALAVAADAGRFADGDLASILHHRRSAEVIELGTRPSESAEAQSLQRSTAAWEGFGAIAGQIGAQPAQDETLSADLRPSSEPPRVIGHPAQASGERRWGR